MSGGAAAPLWSKPRQPGQLTIVQNYPADRSLYGVFDLAGNAREWCRDLWSENVYEEAMQADNGVARDFDGPRRPRDRSLRVVRGSDSSWSVTYREGLSGLTKSPTLGFRCVVEFDAEAVKESQVQRRRTNDDDNDD